MLYVQITRCIRVMSACRCLVQCRDVLHLAWSSTVTVAQPGAVQGGGEGQDTAVAAGRAIWTPASQPQGGMRRAAAAGRPRSHRANSWPESSCQSWPSQPEAVWALAVGSARTMSYVISALNV